MQESTNGVAAIDDLLNRAFQLSYLLIGDRMTAVGIAMTAMDNLKVATSVQDKRHSYVPTGGSASRASRTKVRLNDVHLLQRLVYIESEIYERLQEQQEGTLRQEDLIIHFIKHLVRIATKRNSFYVSLAISRLLYNYATSEAMEIYNLVVQDPDRIRDDYYYRSRKGRLMNELKERFGDLVQTYRNQRREERFRAHNDSEKYASFVKECLIRFTPWFTACVLPSDTELTKNIIRPLMFKGLDPDEEHSIEVDRIHTLLHPNCYARLVLALRLDPPEKRLEVPYFFISGRDGDSTDDRFKPPSLTDQELKAIKSSLDSKAKRRKGRSSNSLRVYVDGVQLGSIALAQAARIQLKVDSNAEVIQVRAVEGPEEIILATHLLAHDESGLLSSKSAIIAEGGQKVSFSVSSDHEAASEALVSIEYRETRLTKAVLLSLSQLKYRMGYRSSRSKPGSFEPAFIFILLMIAAMVALFIYMQSRSKVDQPIVSEQKDADSTSPSPSNQNKRDAQEPTPDRRQEQVARGDQVASATGGSSTRGPQPRINPAVLLSVNRIFVSSLGDSPLSRQVREDLINRLRTISRFTIVESPAEADAAFKGTVEKVGKNSEKAAVVLRLVNVEGQIIWPLRKNAFTYTGNVAAASDKLIQDFLYDIQKLQRVK